MALSEAAEAAKASMSVEPTPLPTAEDPVQGLFPSAYQQPAERWARVGAQMAALQGQLPEGEGLVSLPWPSDGSADSVDSLIDLATAALARDGACIISDAIPRAACEALLAETTPYIDACHRAEGTGNSRPGCVIGRARSSWEFVLHPVLRGLCEVPLLTPPHRHSNLP